VNAKPEPHQSQPKELQMATRDNRTPKIRRKSAAVPTVPETKTLDSGNLDIGESNDLLRSALRRGDTPTDRFGYWGLPARGGYSGGGRAGQAAARVYLKFLRDHTPRYTGGSLQSIALDMLDAKPKSDPRHSFRGQIVGFFCEIDQILHSVVSQLPYLDETTFASLAHDIDKGLARTAADEEAEITASRSKAAREAWKRRKAKMARARRSGRPRKSEVANHG
jgi:hypothetical protein